jgi:hypothetical protein
MFAAHPKQQEPPPLNCKPKAIETDVACATFLEEQFPWPKVPQDFDFLS